MKNTNSNAFRRTRQRPEHQADTPPDTSTLLPKAKDDRKVIGFRITEDKRRAFKIKATEQGTTVQEVLNDAVDRFLND